MNNKPLDLELVARYIDELDRGVFKPSPGRPSREVLAAIASRENEDPATRRRAQASLDRCMSGWTPERRDAQRIGAQARLTAARRAIEDTEECLKQARAAAQQDGRAIDDMRRALTRFGAQERRALEQLRKMNALAGPDLIMGL
ncbi:MAG: hypothetical protein KGL39_25820 [Patescibacteria group bacterium]|nr:hypothetical protein [Patescibacteria group bacterium]